MREIRLTVDLIPTFVYGVIKAVHERSLRAIPNAQESSMIDADYLRKAAKDRLVELESIEHLLENDKSENIFFVILRHNALNYIRRRVSEYEFLCDLLQDQVGPSLAYVKFGDIKPKE